MTELELLRLASVAAFVLWIITLALIMPMLAQAGPGRHPLLQLLIVIAFIETLRTLIQMDAAFSASALSTQDLGTRASFSIVGLRLLTCLEALVFIALLKRAQNR